jgi:hypothetical protein
LVSEAESTVSPRGGQSPDEFHAPLAEPRVESVVGWDVDGQAGEMG